jgi:hypothetical protein
MYVCLYLYVYLFYCVYCVPCTANRKPVCHFTCGLLTFTEARRDRTTAHHLHPRPAGPTPNPLGPRNASAASLGTWRSLTQRLSVRRRGLRSVHAARTVRTPIRRQRKRRCMPCRCMLNPPLATGNRTRHVCAADNLQTRCKQQAPESPLKQYPETVQKLGKCPPSRASEDALRRTKCAN